MNTAKVDGCNELSFSMTKGTTWSWDVLIQNSKGKIQALEEYAARMDIRYPSNSDSSNGVLLYRLSSIPFAGQGTLTILPLDGKITMNIPVSDSVTFPEGCYIYDLVITSPALQVYQILKGNFTVHSTVTTL